MEQRSVLYENPVSSLTRHLLLRILPIGFVLGFAADLLVDVMQVRPLLLNALLTAIAATFTTLPVLFILVILPAARVISQEAAAAADRRLHATLQAVRDGVSLIDISGRIVFANRAVERLRGYAPGMLVGERIQSIASMDIAEIESADIAAFLAGEPTQLLNLGAREVMGKNRNGDLVPLEISWNSLPAAAGSGAPLFVAVSRDISARKRTEAALRESEALFRTLADTAPVMIWMADAAGTLTFLSKGWLDFRGRVIEQELNFGWAEGLHPEDYSRCLATYDQAVRDRKPYEMEYRMRRFDGEYRWLLDRGVPRYGQEEELEGFVGICVDVTLRKQAEEALRASERRFRELLEGLPVAVRIVQDEKVVFANMADALLHGYRSPAEELGLGAANHVAPEEAPRLREFGRRRTAGEPAPRRYEARRRRCDDSEFLAESEVERTLFDGRPANLIVIRDLTDRKRVELYEKLLPVCCVCGKIRNEDGTRQGASAWQRLDQYLAMHSDTEFSHTFCPECFLEYRRKNLFTT